MEKNIYAISYKMRRELEHRILTVTGLVVSCIIVLTLFMTFIIFPVSVSSISMEPELPAGSIGFVSPLLRTPSRGDIVLLTSQQKLHLSLPIRIIDKITGFFTAQRFFPFTSTHRVSGTQSIRRVVALPGDTIYLENFILHIKPQGTGNYLTESELSNMKYTTQIESVPSGWDSQIGVASKTEPYTLGPDEFFVLGDNRTQCTDSRLWGPVSLSRIRGKFILIYFPFNHFKWFQSRLR